MVGAKGPKKLIFDAFDEGYLCLLKKKLFLSICRLFHLVFKKNVHKGNLGTTL